MLFSIVTVNWDTHWLWCWLLCTADVAVRRPLMAVCIWFHWLLSLWKHAHLSADRLEWIALLLLLSWLSWLSIEVQRASELAVRQCLRTFQAFASIELQLDCDVKCGRTHISIHVVWLETNWPLWCTASLNTELFCDCQLQCIADEF